MCISDWSSDVCSSDLYLNSETSASPSTLLGTRSTVLSPAGTPVDADGNGVPDSTLAGLYNTCISLPESVLGAIGLGGACGPRAGGLPAIAGANRSEEHTSELQSLMRSSYAVFCLKTKKTTKQEYTKLKT